MKAELAEQIHNMRGSLSVVKAFRAYPKTPDILKTM